MRRLAPLIALLLLPAMAAPAAAQTPPPSEQRIAPGVKAGGLDVGNLTVPQAAVYLQQTYGPRLYNPISVRLVGRRFRLTPAQSKLSFDINRTAQRAYDAGRTDPAADVPLAISLDRARVRTFARGRRPRDLPRAPRREHPHHAAPHLPPQVRARPLARRQGAARLDRRHAHQPRGAAHHPPAPQGGSRRA